MLMLSMMMMLLFRRSPAWRYNGMAIGLDNKSPWHSAPEWLQYDLCGRYVGPTVTPPVNLTFPCSAAGRYRYVIVQAGHEFPSALCLDEVQVFASFSK